MTLQPFASADNYTGVIGSAPARAEWDLDGAAAAIRRYCGWNIWPRITETLVVNGSGGYEIHLPTLKLHDVTACTELWSYGYDPVATDVAGLEWSEAGYLRKHTPWTNRLRGVTVTIDHGFNEVPDLASLCLDLAARVAAGPAGIVQQSAGMRSMTFARSLTDVDKVTLDLYRVQ